MPKQISELFIFALSSGKLQKFDTVKVRLQKMRKSLLVHILSAAVPFAAFKWTKLVFSPCVRVCERACMQTMKSTVFYSFFRKDCEDKQQSESGEAGQLSYNLSGILTRLCFLSHVYSEKSETRIMDV